MPTDATALRESETFTEALFGGEVLASPRLARFRAWPAEYRTTSVATILATLILVPYLGSVGLWDPWETHYGEVAREMIQRRDYVHPYWENAWFFSKPALTMWMQALGMRGAETGPLLGLVLGVPLLAIGALMWTGHLGRRRQAASPEARSLWSFWGVLLVWVGLVFSVLGVFGLTENRPWKFAGIASGDGALPLFTEWGFRLPFTGFSILAVALLTWALTRVVNPRVALSTALVLLSMPLYFLISRQAVTDTPIVAATISGIACSMVGLLDRQTKNRGAWWYAAYAFFAVATLGKGLLGFGIPMVMGLAYVVLCVVPTDSGAFTRHLDWLIKFAGRALLLGVAAGALAFIAAYLVGRSSGTMFISGPPVDGKDLLKAPGWLGIMWGSLAFWVTTTATLWWDSKRLTERPPEVWALFYDMRLGTGIILFLAICLPWYYEMFTYWRVDDESKLFWYRFLVHDHFARLGAGVHTTTPGGGFTYFIEQGGYAMFPWVLAIPGALATVARLRIRGGNGADGAGVIAVLWFVLTWALIGASATKFHHYVFPLLAPMAILIGLFIDKLWTEGIAAHGVALLLGAPLFLLVGKDLAANPKDFTDLFVYNYDRPYPDFLTQRPVLGTNNIRMLMGYSFAFVGALLALFALARSKSSFFTTALASALAWAVWFNYSHWVDLSHHWTQRDQFWRYYSQRRPGEPIAAFLMNWRGETFYSRNTVKQIKDNANAGLLQYAQQPGRKWSLVEHSRLGVLKGAVPPDKTVTVIDKDLNNKFALVTIE